MKARRREQPPVQRGVVKVGRERPAEPDHSRSTQVFRHRRSADTNRPGDHPLTDAAGVLQTKNFSDLAHRQSLSGHRTSLAFMSEGTLAASQAPMTLTRWKPSGVAAFNRNQWPAC